MRRRRLRLRVERGQSLLRKVDDEVREESGRSHGQVHEVWKQEKGSSYT